MTSAHAAHSEPGHSTDGDMRRLRRRGRIATGIGGAGYITTFITGIVDTDVTDEKIAHGLEMGFLAAAVLGILVVIIARTLTESVAFTRMACGLDDRAAAGVDTSALDAALTNAASTSSTHGPHRNVTP